MKVIFNYKTGVYMYAPTNMGLFGEFYKSKNFDNGNKKQWL